MKEFDFQKAKEQGQSAERLDFYKKNKDVFISEGKFIEEITKLRKMADGKSQTWAPGRLRKTYKDLRKNFGFFPMSKREYL